MPSSTPTLLATTVGIIGSGWTSGAIASISLASVPAILSAPSTTATTWAAIFARGMAIMPRFAITSALGHAYAAYDARQNGRPWGGFVAGAVLTVAIVPYTMVFMGGTNEVLHRVAGGLVNATQSETATLVRRWGALNIGRSFLPLIGALVSTATFFSGI